MLSLVDDVELITKELIENAIAPKPKKMSASDHAELTQLLVQKDKELKGYKGLINYCEVGYLDRLLYIW